MAMLRNLLLLSIMFYMGNAAIGTCQCPYGWSKYGVKCYRFISQSATWATAEKNCQSLGANLASVHNKAENDFLLSLIPGSTTRCWIGGHDGEQEGQWLWTDGSVIDYNNWCATEPNNQNIENCLEMQWTVNRCWNDQGCSTPMGYMCAANM